ncbi:hypothetical protein BaRGS_00037689 [Batillaria attramentaria]|uniref:Carbohydrate sulfotransferase n=1 Tax=Batillaria attramentaria TaxID=370345 RepID=A0ABD0J7Z2_9CAEN
MAWSNRKLYALLTILGSAIYVSLLLNGHLFPSAASVAKIYQRLAPVKTKTATDTRKAVTPLSTFQQRRQHFIDTCTARRRLGNLNVTKSLQVFHVGDLAMCLVPKTGSTLWKQILFYLDTNQSGPFFEVNFSGIHRRMQPRSQQAVRILREGVVTAVFVREPYSRLFSAYVDKLFKPREDNWRVYGRPVVNYVRRISAAVGKTCAGNVTFAEFVRYFIDSETKPEAKLRRNEHYTPQSQHCGFCTSVVGSRRPQDNQRVKMVESVDNKRQGVTGQMDNTDTSSMGHFQDKLPEGFLVYDFIGKTESIVADTWAILEASHLARRLPASLDMVKDAGKDTIARTIQNVFESANTTTSSCVSKEEKLRRMWKNFQIRGMISKRELFPLTSAEADDVTIEGMQELALSAFDRSTSDPELKGNKMEAMIEAYSTIPLTDRQALRRIYAADFELFQYPPSIPEVFPEGDKFHLGSYRFFNIFDK